MTGRHVPTSETGADGPHPEWDDLLDGRRLPETEDDMRVADAVAALQAPGTVDELRDADTAVPALLAVLVAAPWREGVIVPLAPRRRARTAAIAGSVVAATLVLTGTAAAAATGSLPAPLQRIAQSLVGAPAPVSDDPAGKTATPSVGSGPAASTSSPHAGPAPSDRPTTAAGPGAPEPGPTPGAGSSSAGTHPATPTPPGQSVRPSTPPGATVRPTVPPGQTHRPTAAPGQGNRPTALPSPSGRGGNPHS